MLFSPFLLFLLFQFPQNLLAYVKRNCEKDYRLVQQTNRAGWSGQLALVQNKSDSETSSILAQKVFMRNEFFDRDLQMLQAVKGIPGVSQIVDYCTEPTHSLIMEYYPGPNPGSLDLSPAKFQAYFLQLVQTLKSLSARNICHLDIKGDNIVSTSDGMAILIDFNLARFFNETEYWVGEGGAPELVLGMKQGNKPGLLSPKSDIYHLARHFMFNVKGNMVKADPLFQDLIAKMMEKDPAKRIDHDQILAHPFSTRKMPSSGGRSNHSLTEFYWIFIIALFFLFPFFVEQ
jgi:serine/threonine protein kinase